MAAGLPQNENGQAPALFHGFDPGIPGSSSGCQVERETGVYCIIDRVRAIRFYELLDSLPLIAPSHRFPGKAAKNTNPSSLSSIALQHELVFQIHLTGRFVAS